jgi:hypothetical protein
VNPGKAYDEPQTHAERRASMTWAQRLKRVFGIDIETCRECGVSMKVIACIEYPVVIQNNLDHTKDRAETTTNIPLPESWRRRPVCSADVPHVQPIVLLPTGHGREAVG